MPVFTICLQGDADLVSSAGDDLPLVYGYKLVAVGDKQVGEHLDKGPAFTLPLVVNGGGEA